MRSPEQVCEVQRAALAEVWAVEADAARLFARQMQTRYDLSSAWGEATGPEDFAVLELAGTARIGQGRAATQLSDAARLVEVLRATHAQLKAGRLYVPTAELLLRFTRRCSEQVAAEVEHRTLPVLAGLNAADARRLLLETVVEVQADLDPEGSRDREQQAAADRNVWARPLEDGMCQVGANLPALAGRRWALDFEELVRAQKIADQRAGTVRNARQRRADVFATLPSQLLALLQAIAAGDLTGLLALAAVDPDSAESVADLAETTTDLHPTEAAEAVPVADEPAASDPAAGPSATALAIALLGIPLRDPKVLNVHVPMSTLLEIDHRCGWVQDLGPVSAHLTRMLLPVAPLRRVLVDHRSGIPLHLDPELHPPPEPDPQHHPDPERQAVTNRLRLLTLIRPGVITHSEQPGHDPNASLDELLALRDRTCTGIGCSMPTRQCDNDHETRWPDGPTAAWNLSNKSKRCHHAKHHGWDVQRNEHTGVSIWRSPLGHTYRRPGVWRAPSTLPDNLTLKPPAALPTTEPRGVHERWDHPLDQDLPEPPPPPPPANSGWDDDPPF